jgi:hypothetical protein
MTGRSSIRRRIAVVALLVSGAPALAACTLHPSSNGGPSQPEPTQGPFASVGTETIPAAP